MDVDLGQLDWTAVAALATLALAAVTYFLARETRGLARSTAAEVAAQAQPQMVPGGPAIVPPGVLDGIGIPNLHEVNAGRFRISVRNAGPGTALNVYGRLEPDAGLSQRVMAIPAGEEVVLDFPDIYANPQRLTMEYADISDREYRSVIGLKDRHPNEIREMRVYEFDGVWLSGIAG